MRFYYHSLSLLFLLVSCSPIKLPVKNYYALEQFDTKRMPSKSARTILVTPPEALGGYQSDQMLYINKPFQVNSFVHNAWLSPPANMLFPLIVQSLEQSHYFHAVASSPFFYRNHAHYQLDIQLIKLQQNFLTRPSHIELDIKITLIDTSSNKIIASKVFDKELPCSFDTPFGGVIAANHATRLITKEISSFIINKVGHSFAT